MKRWKESVSKQLALMIFISGNLFAGAAGILGIILHDASLITTVLITLLPATYASSAGLVAVKTHSATKGDK